MHQLEIEVQRPAGLPADAYWEMIDATQELRRLEAAAARAYEEGAQRLAAAHSARVRELVAAATKGDLERYDAFRNAHRDRLRALTLRPRPDTAALKKFDAQRRKLVAESDKFLAELGIDVAALRQANLTLQRGLALLVQTTADAGVPAEVRPRVKNTTFTLPYNGTLAAVTTFAAREDSSDDLPPPAFDLFLDRQLGKLGNDSAISVSDASDYDEAFVKCNTALLQWYQMPKTGQVQVRYKAQWVAAHTDGSVYNEWGESDLQLWQSASQFARVISPTPTAHAFWPAIAGFYDTNQDDHQWSSNNAQIGFEFDSGNVIVPQVFPKGKWVLVECGMAHANHFISNDCGVVSHLSQKLFVEEIGISVA